MSCRRVLAVVLALTAGLCVAPAGAAAGCINGSSPSDSAINQYCETIPASTGGQTPDTTTPTLATVLPRRILDRLAVGGSRRGVPGLHARDHRHLLSLPAPVRRPTAQHQLEAASTDAFSPFGSVLIILGCVAALLVATRLATALARRRRTE